MVYANLCLLYFIYRKLRFFVSNIYSPWLICYESSRHNLTFFTFVIFLHSTKNFTNLNWHKYFHYLSVIFPLWCVSDFASPYSNLTFDPKYDPNRGHVISIQSYRFDLSDKFYFFEPKSIQSACTNIFCVPLDHLFIGFSREIKNQQIP